MDEISIGQFIKDIRKKNNLTQKDLAEKYGVTYQAVSKWERGLNMPDKTLIIQMSKDFNISLDDIFNGEYSNKKNNKKKLIYILSSILIIILIGITIYYRINNNNDNFTFKTLSSSCKEYTIEGVLSYNSSKSAIYISNITYCGNDKTSKFKEIECTLYENNNEIKTKISSYKYNDKETITLEDFLKNVRFKKDNYTRICTKYTKDSLELDIIGTTIEGEVYSHIIPVSIDNNCK